MVSVISRLRNFVAFCLRQFLGIIQNLFNIYVMKRKYLWNFVCIEEGRDIDFGPSMLLINLCEICFANLPHYIKRFFVSVTFTKHKHIRG